MRRSPGLGLALVVAFAIVAALPAAYARTSALDARGSVHRVSMEQQPDVSSGTVGTAIVYRIVGPDGDVETTVLPWTSDGAIDRDPTLDLDPMTETPVIIWSRNVGSGFVLMITRREGGEWTAPEIVPGTADGADHLAPDLRIRSNLAHVVWRREAGGTSEWLRVGLRRDSLALAFGPEVLLPGSEQPISPSGGSAPAPETATSDLTYFATGTSRELPGGSSGQSIIVWGIRDEPIPITYSQAFDLPEDARAVTRAGAAWMRGSFVVWGLSGGEMFYSIRADGTWSDFRRIPVEPQSGLPGALGLVDDMLRRETERSLPD